MARKEPAARSIGIDLDKEVLGAFPAREGLELVSADAVAFLRGFDYAEAGRVLVYADPPYLHSTRTSRNRYRYEYNDADHATLLYQLRELAAGGVNVMLSGYPSELYDQLLPDWRVLEFQVMTRGGPRTEKLWMSFSSEAAHWSSYAGVNFTDRQRIKRKAARWADNYKALPPGERLAVLAALLAVEPD